MTDEQRPWQEWPEYRGMLDLVAVTGATKHTELDALCARVWREARRDKADAHAALDAALDKATGDVLEAERARADAAETRADRLAAALARVLPDYSTYRHMPDEGVLRWERAAGTLKDARAALADVPEPVRETLADPEAMAAIQRGAAEVARGEPGTPVSALRRKYDDRQHRTDVPDAGRVQAFRARAGREAQAIAADPDVDRMARQARLRREAYTAMRRTLERTRCHCHPRDGSWWTCERCVALALARQAEEG